MKNVYEAPALDIIFFTSKDILTASGEPDVGFGGEDDGLGV